VRLTIRAGRTGTTGRGVLALASLALLATAPGLARAQANAYNSIGLEWEAGGDDGDVGRASAYDVRYRTTAIAGTDTISWWNGATQVSGEPVPSPSGTTDSTRVTGLQQGTTYYFIIRAVDDGGNPSPFSNVASATTLACNAPTAIPGSFTAAADTGLVDLSWTGSDPLATSLKVYRAAGGGSMSLRTTLAANATSYRDTSVQPGQSYSYRVAWSNVCADGPTSPTRTVTLPGAPPPPPPGASESATLHAFPNPSSGSVTFSIRVPGSTNQDARVRLFDMSGRWVATIVERSLAPGEHAIAWSRTGRDGRPLAPGYYEAIGSVGGTRVRERIVLVP
jgi:hypothetical protein